MYDQYETVLLEEACFIAEKARAWFGTCGKQTLEQAL